MREITRMKPVAACFASILIGICTGAAADAPITSGIKARIVREGNDVILAISIDRERLAHSSRATAIGADPGFALVDNAGAVQCQVVGKDLNPPKSDTALSSRSGYLIQIHGDVIRILRQRAARKQDTFIGLLSGKARADKSANVEPNVAPSVLFRSLAALDPTEIAGYQAKFKPTFSIPSVQFSELMQDGVKRTAVHEKIDLNYGLGKNWNIQSHNVISTEAADTTSNLGGAVLYSKEMPHFTIGGSVTYAALESFTGQTLTAAGNVNRALVAMMPGGDNRYLQFGQYPSVSVGVSFLHQLQLGPSLAGGFTNTDLLYVPFSLNLTSLYPFPNRKYLEKREWKLEPNLHPNIDFQVGGYWFPNAKLVGGFTVHRIEPSYAVTLNVPVRLLGRNTAYISYSSTPNTSGQFVRVQTLTVGIKLFGSQIKLWSGTP